MQLVVATLGGRYASVSQGLNSVRSQKTIPVLYFARLSPWGPEQMETGWREDLRQPTEDTQHVCP